MADEVQQGSFEDSDKGLKRSLSLTQLLLLGVSAQIGSGWLFGVLAAAGVAGPAAILSWIIASILVFLIALTYLELGSMLPRSGAIVRYTYLTHGSLSGWIIGWAYWLSVVSIPPIEAEAVLTYLGGRFPEAHFLTTKAGVDVLSWPVGILSGVVLMLVFFVLNFFGAKFLAESNRWVTIWKIALPTITFIFLFFILNGSNFHAYGGFAPEGAPPIFHAIATTGIIFSLLGFRQALDYGGESKNPQRDVPWATFGSIAIPAVIYTLLQVAFIGAINWADMGLKPGQWDKLVNGGWADGPLFHALDSANIAALAALGTFLLIDAAVSPLATGWVYLGTGARTGYGLGVARNIPPIFQSNNRFGIPWLALVVSAVVGCVFFVPAPSWYQLVGFISSAAVLTYIMGGVSLPVLRRTASVLPRPFRLRGANFWSVISFLAAVLILYWGGFSTLANVFTATFIGLPIFTAYYAWRRGWMSPIWSAIVSIVFFVLWVWVAYAGGWVLTSNGGQRPGGWSFIVYDIVFCALVIAYCVAIWLLSSAQARRHVTANWWLIWLLLASFQIAYLGDYGPLKDPVLIFPWGIVAEVVVGIIAYVWGVRTGFATEEIKDIVAGYERGLEAAKADGD
ncbi:APC family permease [Spelaeicoccus albus]|uniref:Amino acid transporter n=1 Tax=Spelaeicoccus albus TaxID=1280376 RepID=A0A7Z0CZE0_9MICO|nr:APC family permease [Spelaeicoccus albus]NYI66221.1 amino acid transporter [Spelaeicoccus albus]